MKQINLLFSMLVLLVIISYVECNPISTLEQGFVNPPDEYHPGVYWYFNDGNLSEEGITKDLESMKQAGISYVLFLEVNVGISRGYERRMAKMLYPCRSRMQAAGYCHGSRDRSGLER